MRILQPLAYRNGVRIIWEHRQVLRMLVLRDLQKQYTKFRLGYLWTLLEPLGMAVVLWFVFTELLGGRKLGLQPYFLFLAVAILPWWWFSKGVSGAAKTFRRNPALLQMSLLPTKIWVIRVVLVSMAEYLLSLPVILIAMLITRTLPGPLIVLFPVGVIVQFFLMYGLAMLIAAGAAVIPDLARIVRIVLRATFYLSPVLYSIANIPAGAQVIAAINPLVGVLGLYRIGFWPTEIESLPHYGISLGVTVAVFIAGSVVFHRLESRILKGN
ncbi:MAG: ABC transporter permease [Candidatus Nanopelagicales bacterium]|nr:ABC transporter permease [Candidatus Nanopelagicales bacterium]